MTGRTVGKAGTKGKYDYRRETSVIEPMVAIVSTASIIIPQGRYGLVGGGPVSK